MATNNTQTRLKEQDDRFKISIRNDEHMVQAPLPDDFGFTVGSEYSEPFDAGAMSETWQRVFAVGGISQKMGIRMRKMFTNPEPTEISFDMEFYAHYSAKDEVFIPIFKLMMMTLGTRLTWDKVEDKAKELIETVAGAAGGLVNLAGLDADTEVDTTGVENEQVNQAGGRLLALINLVNSPKYVNIQWGRIMKWRKCYITSVTPSFSNVVDSDGFPMYAKASITITPEMYPIADDMIEIFSNGRITS